MRHASIIAVMILLGAVGVACSSAGPPSERALDEGYRAVLTGVDAGVAATEEQESLALRARYNPCNCSAPDFEVHLHGQWSRAMMEGDAMVLGEMVLRIQGLEEAGRLYHLRVEGKLNGKAEFEDTRVDYQRIQVRGFEVEAVGSRPGD